MHRKKRITDKVDLFISPSEFLVNKFFEAGFDRRKFEVLPYFVDMNEILERNPGDYALYAGRLSPEKGVHILIDAWRSVDKNLKLKIAGSGPSENDLRERAANIPNIEFLGFIEPEKLRSIRREASFTIAPSICWDNLPISVLESVVDGVPVVGANIGGIPEIVVHGVNGILFEPGDSDSLGKKVNYLFKDPDLIESLGRNARRIAENLYSPEEHIKKLESLYARLIDQKR